jgi:hypothetical protein
MFTGVRLQLSCISFGFSRETDRAITNPIPLLESSLTIDPIKTVALAVFVWDL